MEKERELEKLLVLAKQGDQEAQLAIVTGNWPPRNGTIPGGRTWPANWCWAFWKPSGNIREKMPESSQAS